MWFKILDNRDKREFTDEIINMLNASDNEFVPPLSARVSTTDKNLSGGKASENGVFSYFDGMLKQKILGAFESENLLGLVSFKENYTSDDIPEDALPNIYISTLLVKPEARGKGLTKLMYGHLFNELYGDRKVFTRTWSTNTAHIKILDSFGFEEISRIKNDRGNGIDTVYFAKN